MFLEPDAQFAKIHSLFKKDASSSDKVNINYLYYFFQSGEEGSSFKFAIDVLMVIIGIASSHGLIIYYGKKYQEEVLDYLVMISDLIQPNFPSILLVQVGKDLEANVQEKINLLDIFEGRVVVINNEKDPQYKNYSSSIEKSVGSEEEINAFQNVSEALEKSIVQSLLKMQSNFSLQSLSKWKRIEKNESIYFYQNIIHPNTRLFLDSSFCDYFGDLVLTPISKECFDVQVSYSAMHKFQGGASIILVNPKTKRLLQNCSARNPTVFLSIGSFGEEDSLVVNFATYLSQMALATLRCEEGDLLAFDLLREKKKFVTSREKLLLVLHKGSEKAIYEEEIKKFFPDWKSTIYNHIICKRSSYVVYPDPFLNMHLLFGEELIADLESYFRTFPCVENCTHKFSYPFDLFLKAKMHEFLPCWNKKADFEIFEVSRDPFTGVTYRVSLI